MYQIRQAVELDIPAISKELKDFSAHFATKLPPYKDDETSAILLKTMIDKHLFFISEDAESYELVGLIAGFVCDHIYNPDIRTLVESFWWVKPEHRKSGVGIELLEAFQKWGEENVDWVLMTIEDGTPIDDRVLTGRGFRLKEKSYILETS